MAKKQVKKSIKRTYKLQAKSARTVEFSLKKEIKLYLKPIIASLKPTITALVFLLVSSFAQQLMDRLQTSKPCPVDNAQTASINGSTGLTNLVGAVFAGVSSVEADARAKALELEGQTVLAGSRALRITKHAAQRMVERQINKDSIAVTVNSGKLFAYAHAKLVKIGYYNTVTRVFVAVDQQHNKILTVIHNVPAKYISKLINLISKPLSLNWSRSYVTHSYLAGLAGVEWFVLYKSLIFSGFFISLIMIKRNNLFSVTSD